MLREGVHDTFRCTRLNITRKLPDSAKVLTARSAMSCPAFKKSLKYLDTMKLVQGIPSSPLATRGLAWAINDTGGSNVLNHPDKSFPKCALSPKNNFAHSMIVYWHVLFFFCFFFGLKYPISRVTLLKLQGISKNFVSIMLIPYRHSSIHWEGYCKS